MKTKFKHLTPGYCGYQQQELTLNSYFYGYIFSQPDLLKKKLLFPQRTPSPDFIAEIIQNEGPDARHQITKQLDFIRSRIENHSYLTEQEIVNWYNIALRFAQFDTIIDNCPTNAIGHAELAFFYLKTKDYEKAESFFSAAANLGPPIDWNA